MGVAMDRARRGSPVTTLLVILIGMMPTGCADTLDQTAQVRVVISGMTKQTNVATFVLFPGVYDFVASGVADADSADITLTVLDRNAVEIDTVQFSLTLAEANASPGDTGSGENTGVDVVEGVQSVSIDFRWQGSTPIASVGLDISFYDNPDIVSVTTTPEPPVKPATRVDVQVQATNNEGSQAALTVDSQFVDASSGSVINMVALYLDVDGLFKGEIAAPGYPGDHGLRIVATDNTGGTTRYDMIYSVQ